MLGGSVGLVRLKDSCWEQLIPDWPEHVYVSCLHMVRDDLALIGLFDGGVLVAELAARTLKRITLGWSYYDDHEALKQWFDQIARGTSGRAR